MKFQVINKKVILIDRTMRLVGDNEYEFEFEFDEEWSGKIKTARFVMGDYKKDIVLNNDKCLVEKTFFKGGQLKVGVYASNLATEVLERKVKSSILEEDGGEPTVPENLWTQLLEIIDADVQSVRKATSDAQNIVDGFGDVVKSKQEEFNTYAAKKQTEYNQNAANKIREYDEHIIDYTAEINSLKSDLGDCVNKLGIYKPLNESGTTTSSGNEKIVENIELVSHRNYTLTATLESPSDAATYFAFWSDTINPEGYTIVLTIPAGELTATRTKFIVGNATDGYITINTGNRTVNWNVTLTDDAEHPTRLDTAEENLSKIEASLTNVGDYVYQKNTVDMSFSIRYTDRADAYADSELIDVVYGDIVKTYNQYTPYRQINAYHGSTLVDTADNVWEYKVSDASVTNIKLTVYKNQKGLEDTVIFTHSTESPMQKDISNYVIRKPRVTFIDDDGNVEFYTHLLPIMRAQNIPMVSAYMGDSNPDMQSNTAMMTKEQCKAVVDAGGEIIVHYNPDLTTLSLDEAERIVLKSKNVLKKYGFDSDLIAYSNGTSNPEIRAMISKHFKCAFTGSFPRVSDTDRTNHDVIPQYFIHREHVGGLYYDTGSTTYGYFKNLVDECVANNGWLVFILHSWLMPDGQKKSEFENINQFELLQQVIEYIKSLEETTGIKIVTASEGLEMFGNVFQSGDYLGHWNEMTLTAEESTMMGGHNDAGCAINKVGQYDFPTSKKINH